MKRSMFNFGTLASLLLLAILLLGLMNDTKGFVPPKRSSLHTCSLKSSEVDIEEDAALTVDDLNITEPLDPNSLPLVPLAPQLTFEKYLTMQVRDN